MADTDKWNEAAKYASMMNMVDIAVYIMCIGLSWWALQAFRFDVLLKRPKALKRLCCKFCFRLPSDTWLQVFSSSI